MWTIKDRKFGQRLTFFEKWLLYKEIQIRKKSVFDTWKKFKISKSTMYKIINDFKRTRIQNPWILWNTQRPIRSSKTIVNHISSIWESYQYPFTANDVSQSLFKMLRIKLWEKTISQILKESLGLSFKKGKSCPVSLHKKKHELLKCLFVAKMIPFFSTCELLINIDETSFSRHTKIDYSWLKKGYPWKLRNITFINSTSLVTAITSSGKIFAASIDGSGTAFLFEIFLIKLKQFIEEHEQTTLDQWIILMDNASTHRSKTIYKCFKDNHMRVVYIPPYMPELAPIERLFSILKHLTMKRSRGKLINLKLNEADKMINKAIQSIDTWAVQRLWQTFVSEVDNTVDSIFQNAKPHFI